MLQYVYDARRCCYVLGSAWYTYSMNLLLRYRVFIYALVFTVALLAVKFILHFIGWEPIYLDRLHSSVISGTIFVIGFLLSATIRDYKEAERIPAEVASTIENMYEDALSIKQNYPKFDFDSYQKQLAKIAKTMAADLRNSRSHRAKLQLHKLNQLTADMEKVGVPANFIVKLKQQHSSLLRHLYRVNYIQRITFIPSANILAWAIVGIGIILLLLTEMESFLGSLIVVGAIIFILIYVSLLIHTIKTPFQDEGKTKDDVSLFLLDRTIKYLQEKR